MIILWNVKNRTIRITKDRKNFILLLTIEIFKNKLPLTLRITLGIKTSITLAMKSALHIIEEGWEGNQTGFIFCSLRAFFSNPHHHAVFSIVYISSHLIQFLSRSPVHRVNEVLWWLFVLLVTKEWIYYQEQMKMIGTSQGSREKKHWITLFSSFFPLPSKHFRPPSHFLKCIHFLKK